MTENPGPEPEIRDQISGNRERNGGGGDDQHPGKGRKDRDQHGDTSSEPILAGSDCAQSRRDDGNC
jgi:hypothetical protein